jgi:carbon monoxide dehydrogenase subunit G
MEMTGEFRIPAPRQRVWEALNDPEILKLSIPGCQALEKVSDTEFNGRVLASVGPVRATFGGKVTLSDLDPPQSYTISGEGSGGVAGFAKGGAKVELTEDGGATVLHYAVQALVGGKLAQIGSRLIDGVARKMANDFFARFAAAVAPEEPPPAAAEPGQGEAAPVSPVAEEEPVVAETAPPAPAPGPATARLPPAVWVTGLAVIVILLLYFFTGHDATR